MKKPEIKNEIVIKTCPNPDVLAIHVATPRALTWIVKEAEQFTDDICFNLTRSKTTPCHKTLIVSPCFDVKEVKAYLEAPQFEKEEPVKLAKG